MNRLRVCIALAVGAGLLACVGGAASAHGGRESASRARIVEHLQFSGDVSYQARECLGGPGAEKPLGLGQLLLVGADGRSSTTEVQGNGHFVAEIDATQPVKAFLVLESSRILVEEDGALASPYKIPLGELHADRRNHLAVTGEGPEGAANIFAVMNQAAEVAAAASPERLPELRVTWRYEANLRDWKGDDGAVPQYQEQFGLNHPRVKVGTQAQAYWDWDLMHEYGHFILDKLAGTPGVRGGTSHSATETFPDKPLVPWLEGFSDGFASIASRNPRPTRDCQSLYGIDVGTAPALPLPDPKYRAQYNEIAVAGVLWHLAELFDSRDPKLGLAPILRAIHADPPHSMREFRDALIKEAKIETTADEHQAIDGAFGDQNIAWGFDVGGLISQNSLNKFQQPTYYQDGEWLEVGFKLVGPAPYNDCQLQSDYPRPPNDPHTGTPIAARGVLSYAWQSNCYDYNDGIVSQGEYPRSCVKFPPSCSTTMGGLIMPFPYPKSGDESANYTLYARWGCLAGPGGGYAGPGNCSSPKTVQLEIFLDNGFTYAGNMRRNFSANRAVNFSVSASQAQWTEIATINGMGKCETAATITHPAGLGRDCSD